MAKLVKVRILKPIGTYHPGQVVSVSEELAKQLCAPRRMNNGHGVVEIQNAITQEDFLAALKAPIDLNGLSQGDMAAMGVKNVVATPADPKADEALKTRAKLAKEAALEAEAKAQAELDAKALQSVNQEQENAEQAALLDPPADDAPPATETDAEHADPTGYAEGELQPEEKPSESKKGRNKKSA